MARLAGMRRGKVVGAELREGEERLGAGVQSLEATAQGEAAQGISGAGTKGASGFMPFMTLM